MLCELYLVDPLHFCGPRMLPESRIIPHELDDILSVLDRANGVPPMLDNSLTSS